MEDTTSLASSTEGTSNSTRGSLVSDECKPPSKNCYRLVLLGSSRVGKTAIVARFLHNKFEDTYTPTIEDFHRKLYRIRGEAHQLDILDTSGNHPFPAMRRLSFLTGDVFILVYSVDSRESFEEVLRLREQILETKLSVSTSSVSSATSRGKKNTVPKVPMIIVGNKCDKEMRTVSTEEASTHVAALNLCGFLETSAKRNVRVDELFSQLFMLAQLPTEMAPNLHRKVSATTPTMTPSTPKSKRSTLSIKRRLSDACGMVTPNARRPSLRTDLMIMRTKTSSLLTTGGSSRENGGRGKRDRKMCIIQ